MATYAGTPGVQGNITDFPTITSGAGASGNGAGGYAGADGGGASGGGGGRGTGNDSSSRGGGGGGGAGGCLDAGGGAGGTGKNTGGAGYHHHTTPTDTTYENALYGIAGNYGTGGAPGANGTDGFVAVRRIGKVQTIDETLDCESIVIAGVRLDWTQTQPGTTSFDTISDYVAVHNGTTWFFFSRSGYVCTSTDLQTYTTKVASNITPYSVVLVGNTLVSLDYSGIIKTASTSDPTTWTQVADLSSISDNWNGLCVGNNEIIAFGSHQHIVKCTNTANLTAWNEVTISGYYNGATTGGMCWNGTEYLCLRSYGYPMVCKSPDGITWTYLGTVSQSMTASPRLLVWSLGRYVQVSNNGNVFESEDGINWTLNDETVPFTSCRAGGISNDQSKIVIVSSYGGVVAIGTSTPVTQPTLIRDAGAIDDTVGTTRNAGTITGTVDDTRDAGPLISYTPDVIIDLGGIEEQVTQTIDCAKIM